LVKDESGQITKPPDEKPGKRFMENHEKFYVIEGGMKLGGGYKTTPEDQKIER